MSIQGAMMTLFKNQVIENNMKTYFTGAEHLGINDTDAAKELIGAWNGRNTSFYYDGVLYHEDDVHLLEELIEE